MNDFNLRDAFSSNLSTNSQKAVKCVVWDLDNTIWNGILLEESSPTLSDEALKIIYELDRRGVLQSVASRGDSAVARAKLREFQIAQYFLYPQINWNPKSTSVQTIAASLNIGLDTIVFIDDDRFELDEVRDALPEVRCIQTERLPSLLEMPGFEPRPITEDAQARRLMYLADMSRNDDEQHFVGSREDFLAGLNLIFTVAPLQEGDLRRAEELTLRTNQMNTTGRAYSYEQLDSLRLSPEHMLLIASLEDKYGSYGKIGLALVECGKERWVIKLLLTSCRVISRGVGTLLLSYIMGLAKSQEVRLLSEFIPNGRNRLIYITYRLAGFRESRMVDNIQLLESDLKYIPRFPEYVKVVCSDDQRTMFNR
jgi:FkbH-like protein